MFSFLIFVNYIASSKLECIIEDVMVCIPEEVRE